MKFTLSLCFLLACSVSFAQNDPLTYKLLAHQDLFIKTKRYCKEDSLIVRTEAQWKEKLAKCGMGDSVEIDFSKNAVIHKTSGGDCFSKFKHYVFTDHKNKRITWVEYSYYGGCRAGGFFEFWLVIPKPPDDYALKIVEVNVDSRVRYRPELDTLNKKILRF